MTASTRIVMVSGLGNSGPDHWQSQWEGVYLDCIRVNQTDWETPQIVDWVASLQRAVIAQQTPVIFVAHSFGCSLVARWACRNAGPVAAALLVAPSDVEGPNHRSGTTGLAPMPVTPLWFNSIVIASVDDEYVSVARSNYFVECGQSEHILVGAGGDIGSAAKLGRWRERFDLWSTVRQYDVSPSNQPRQRRCRFSHWLRDAILMNSRIGLLGHELGVSRELLARRRLRQYEEAQCLEIAESGDGGKEHFLIPAAAVAWRAVKAAALRDGITLLIVSAFRTIERQAEIVRRKLDAGATIEEVLTVCAPPGFSEHHTGRAIDISTPGSPALEVAFENTAAYAWLTEQASGFGFDLSYPRGNTLGYQYEPWHWFFRDTQPGADTDRLQAARAGRS